VQLINKILLEELKQNADEHTIAGNIQAWEKLTSQTKKYAGNESETWDRNCKNPKET
jgi:hypothetical protein